VEGDRRDVARVERVIDQLSGLVREGYRFSRGDVKLAAQLVAQDESIEIRDYFLRSALRPAGKRQVTPKSVNQRRYIEAIDRYDIVFGIGPAGTGKTYLAMAQAVSALVAKKVSRIIEVAPIAFMRGRTLNDAFVILDEAQNTTSEQMKMFLTRLGFGAKAVITGDITQIDLPSGRRSGLIEAMNVVRHVEGIAFIHFDERDVVRHHLVQQIVRAYEQFSTMTSSPAANRPAAVAAAEDGREAPSTAEP
jgi:phosphate starvation-inducible PhoH-like protein